MGIGVGVAALGAAAIGAGGSALAGSEQAGAANNATNAQLSMYNQTRQSLMPFINAGSGALPQMQNLLGLGPGGMNQALTTLQSTPGYNWAFGQGLQATNQSLAAQGLNLSGGQIAATTQYGQGMAEQQYNSLVSQYQNLAGLGANAAAGLGQQATATGQGVSQSTQAAGAATGSGFSGAANNIGAGLLTNSLVQNGSYGSNPETISMSAPYTGVGNGYYTPSDRRLKKNIRRIGTLDSGLPVYGYEYKGSHLPQIGVMADEVREIAPHAVHRSNDGYDRVDYRAISYLPGMKRAA